MKRFIVPFIILLVVTALIAAQEEEDAPALFLSVAEENCALELIEVTPVAEATSDPELTPEAMPDPETTPEPDPRSDWWPDLPTYTLSDDCEDLEALLLVPEYGRIWLALLLEDGEDEKDWLVLDHIDDDPRPPLLDDRGRYLGCAIADDGPQVCIVLVELDDVDYLVAVPLSPVEPDANTCVPTDETYCVSRALTPEECPPPLSGYERTCYDSCGIPLGGTGECSGGPGNNE